MIERLVGRLRFRHRAFHGGAAVGHGRRVAEEGSISLLQLGVLLCGEVDVDAATRPSADVVVELLEVGSVGMAAGYEGTELIECGEVEVARPQADG